MTAQIAIVTGASRGIGAAIAKRLARVDFRVALLASEQDRSGDGHIAVQVLPNKTLRVERNS